MITIVIPVYKPKLEKFKIALNSALRTNSDEIIIIDDCTPVKNNEKYLDFLNIIDDKRVKIIFNKSNKGMLQNSLYSLTVGKNDYVKKLDCDDELFPESFDKLISKINDEDLIVTSFVWGKKTKNKNINNHKNILFNGSVIYKKNSIRIKDYKNTPKSCFGDIIPIMNILSRNESKILVTNDVVYNYKNPGSTTPKKLLERSDDWLKGFSWINRLNKKTAILRYNYERQLIFYELMCIKMNWKPKYIEKYKYFKSFNKTPIWLKKIIAYFVFKI